MEAASLTFGDMDHAMPLIEQLVYEQCTKDSMQAAAVMKRNITAWLNPLQNSRVSVGTIISVLTQDIQGQHTGSGSDENGSNTVNITTLVITSTLCVP